LSLEVEDGGRTLAAKYRMHAFECRDDLPNPFANPRNDYTAAKGHDEITLKVASPGGRILGHDVDTAMQMRYVDITTGAPGTAADDVFDYPAPSTSPVEKLVFVGDTVGPEAGTRTGVHITLRQMNLRLESCIPPPPLPPDPDVGTRPPARGTPLPR
jgi:hypothetical protein